MNHLLAGIETKFQEADELVGSALIARRQIASVFPRLAEEEAQIFSNGQTVFFPGGPSTLPPTAGGPFLGCPKVGRQRIIGATRIRQITAPPPTMENFFQTLSGAALMKLHAQEIAALSRIELVRLVMRSKAIVTAVATLSADEKTVDRLTVAEVLNMQPQDIIAALSSASSSASAASSPILLSSEPLPWRPNTRPKLPPGALLGIADDLLWDLFTEWLPIEAVCGLDSALCHKRRRPEFLALISKKILLFNRETFDVSGDKHTTSMTHCPLGAAALGWILKRGIHLASLCLPAGGYCNKTEKESIRESIASLALDGRLDKLETVDLSSCSYIVDADLAIVFSRCSYSVKSVDRGRCHGLAVSSASLVKRCARLEAFAASGNESAEDLAEIFQTLRKLRVVDLSGCGSRLADETVLSLAENCHLLERLVLSSCSAVSDAALRQGAKSWPLLKCVDLALTSISDATVVALCEHCTQLRKMFIAYCDNLTDAAVLEVAERLPGLTHISLNGNQSITSNAMGTLFSKCRELEFINLAFHDNVSDATLKKIAEHCSRLGMLCVGECHDVMIAGLAMIAVKCPELKDDYLGGCPRLEDEQFATLEELFPLVRWYR